MIYKNNSGEDLSIPDHGIVKAGETAELGDNFNNANFVKVKREKVDLKDNSNKEK